MTVSRDEIRSAFLGAKCTSKEVTLASGHKVEVRQPSVGTQLKLAQVEDPGTRMIQMLVDHVFVPGTSEKLFEAGDLEAIKEVPGGGDYQVLMTTITGMMNLMTATEAAAKNSAPTPASS